MKSAYIHIPFCKKLCNYCDFPKFCYQEKWVKPYLKALQKEIKSVYKGEELSTIYIGGGTPSCLKEEDLKLLLDITALLNKSKDIEFTIETNPEDLTKEKIELFQKYGINRVSIGVETFHPSHLKKLGRTLDILKLKESISLLKSFGIQNINVDMMYALPNETKEEVKEDLAILFSLHVPHFSAYSLMIEEHTPLFLAKEKNIDEALDEEMYEEICKMARENGFVHYEISNFSHPGYESKHNLTYWHNACYYGFGVGASGYQDNTRYTNTRNILTYMNGDNKQEIELLSQDNQMEYEMILGLRMLKGVSKKEFEKHFHKQIEEVFAIENLLKQGFLKDENGYLSIPEDKIYLSNEILINFLLS